MNGTKYYREYVGNLHLHSVYSDGTATHAEIAQAAEQAGLNFLITTDHNVWVEGVEDYYGRVLVLVGEEVHHIRRRPQVSHLLVYGAEEEMASHAFGSTQTLVETVRERGGFCFLAHPVEKSSPISPDLEAIPWVDWPLDGVTGLELWNYMSEFKGLLWSHLPALIYAFRPEWGIRGPYRATLRLWDELLAQGQRLAALGGADAHGTLYTFGPVKRRVFPYEYLFRCVNTHVLTQGSLTGDPVADKALLYEALRSGRTWVAYDLPHATRGFQFIMRSGAAAATVGEELKRLGAINVEVTLPATGEMRLLRGGRLVVRARGTELHYTTAEPGIYRLEVYRRFYGRRVGWIFTSPIYVL